VGHARTGDSVVDARLIVLFPRSGDGFIRCFAARVASIRDISRPDSASVGSPTGNPRMPIAQSTRSIVADRATGLLAGRCEP
jgi:hypothetical protein